jgi:large subunit ribosomal protein L24
MPIHISNVALVQFGDAKGDRVGFKEVAGRKVRCFKSNGEAIDA